MTQLAGDEYPHAMSVKRAVDAGKLRARKSGGVWLVAWPS